MNLNCHQINPFGKTREYNMLSVCKINELFFCIAICVFLLGPYVVCAQTSDHESSKSFWDYLVCPLFLFTAFGVLVSYIFTPSGKSKDIKFNKLVFDALFEGGKETLKIMLEIIAVVIIGGLIALIIGEPQSPRQAVMMGLGWTGLITASKGFASKRS